MALYISGHYPQIGAVDVPRNPVIKIYFNNPSNVSSINYKVLTVHDNLYATVPGILSYQYTDAGTPSGVPNILTFTPDAPLEASKEYAVYIHNDPDSVEDIYGFTLSDTIKFKFVTGITTLENSDPTPLEQLQIDLETAVANENWLEAARLQVLIDNGGIPPETGGSETAEDGIEDGILDIRIQSTTPSNGESNVPLSKLPYYRIKFTDNVYISGIDMSDYISLSYKNVLE